MFLVSLVPSPSDIVYGMPKAVHVLNLAIAFAFKSRLTRGNRDNREIIAITSARCARKESPL